MQTSPAPQLFPQQTVIQPTREQLLAAVPHVRKLLSSLETALTEKDEQALSTIFSVTESAMIVDCVQFLSFEHSVRAVVYLSNQLHDLISQPLQITTSPLTEQDTLSQTISIRAICNWLQSILSAKSEELKTSPVAVTALAQFQTDMTALKERYQKLLRLKGNIELLVGRMQVMEL